MSNSYFQFKQFTIHHDQCAMKVGTDGVLLGAWTECRNATSILDIGTGSGLIALMLAQRSDAKTDAIDIDENACKQAERNFNLSPFSSRLKVFHTSIQKYQGNSSYDLIVSNPPFFSMSLKSPDSQRNKARHNDSLSLEELFANTKRLLTSTGRFCLIIPVDQDESATRIAILNHLFLKKKTLVLPTPESKPKRILLEYSQQDGFYSENQLVIETSRHQYSEDFIQLVKEYYLKVE